MAAVPAAAGQQNGRYQQHLGWPVRRLDHRRLISARICRPRRGLGLFRPLCLECLGPPWPAGGGGGADPARRLADDRRALSRMIGLASIAVLWTNRAARRDLFGICTPP